MADYGAPMSQTSDDEDDDQSPRNVAPLSACVVGGGPTKLKFTNINNKGEGGGDCGEMGSTVLMDVGSSKKPRGRPPGSKNKPKPPIVITRDSESAMRPAVLEISAGADVIETVVRFARRRNLGLSIISGSGSVANVTLRHPMTHAPSISLRGPLNIVTLYGTFMDSSSSISGSSPSFAITLSGNQGQLFGGILAGKLIAASAVEVMAATFQNPTFHRLSAEADETEETKAVTGGASESCNTTSGAMSIYNIGSQPTPTPLNCQISPDVLSWGPTTSRSPY